MPINVYINQLLYIGAFFILLLYLIGKHRGKFSVKYYSLYLTLLFTYIVGMSIAFINGIAFDNPPEFIYSDMFRSMVFPLSLAFAGLISRIRGIRHIENITILLVLIFVAGMLTYKFFGFALLGDIVKPSTVQMYNLSFVGFFGFYLLANNRHKIIARFIILTSWGFAVLSLAKWNFFPVLVFPLLWIIIETKGMNTKKRVILCIIIIIVLALALFSLRTNIVRLASGHTWESWESYWYSRVMIPGGRFRTGSRFRIWNDLLQQFSKAPLLGLGFGVRPTFLDAEDHNMFIFFLIRFGIPLFCLAAVLSLMLIIHILRHKDIGGGNRLILFTLFGYFFLSAAIGTSFGQMLNGLTVGGIAGIILNPRNTYIAMKEKR